MKNNSVSIIRKSSERLFRWLFVLAAILCAIVTYIALVRSDPGAGIDQDIRLLLIANSVVLLVLGTIVIRRYLSLRKETRTEGGGRLARRFMLLFGLSAMIPALIVSLFLWVSISNGIDSLFGDRVVTLVEDTATVARANVDEYVTGFEEDAQLMAVDVNNAAEGFRSDRTRFESYLGIQAYLRNIPAAYVIGGDGLPVAIAENMVETGFFRRPSQDVLTEVEASGVVVSVQEAGGFVSTVTKLNDIQGSYLYLAKPLDIDTLNRLSSAQDALTDYREAEQRSAQIRSVFAIAYLQIVALVLLLSVRIAQEFASRLTTPISRLAQAAQLVSEGSSAVSVPLPQSGDEVFDLSQSFNLMTEQLDERRMQLETARRDADERREFVETLLAEVSAGVMQIDPRGHVTLANRSAIDLLELSEVEGLSLSELSPELAAVVTRTRETGDAADTSLEISASTGTRYLHVKATRNLANGIVLTFDDATRLISAQRQLAWRDVARRIAHEIRNPLTPIQLSTERLRRRYSDKLNDDGVFDRCIDTIMRQVSDIGRMVQEFSDFARMPKPSPQKFNLSNLLEQTLLAQQVVTPEIQFSLDAPPQAIEAFGDNRLLGQAFGNIIKNAADAISGLPEPKEIQGMVQINVAADDGKNVGIEVIDNGPGFPADAKTQLLEPYVTTREKGTGLGLAIVNRIIMDHGGVIDLLDREDGQVGARVRIVLPIKLAQDQETSLAKLETAS